MVLQKVRRPAHRPGSILIKDCDHTSPGWEEVLRNEAYKDVRRNDQRCSATQPPDFLRDHQHAII
jgi:hypothetical protein